MGKYVESSLVRNEEIVHEGQPSVFGHPRLLALIGISVLAAVGLYSQGGAQAASLVLVALAVALAAAGVLKVALSTVELAVTNRRVLAKTGLIRRTTSELYLNRIEGVEVDQGLLGRILGYGTVRVRGTGDQVAEVKSVKDPLAFKKAVFTTGDLAGHRNPDIDRD